MTPQILAEEIVAGRRIDASEALLMLRWPCAAELFKAADHVRRELCGNEMNYCSIINARAGRCPEDCKWCSQSRHHQTSSAEYPIVDIAKAVEMAKHNEAKGVHRFSLVTSGRSVSSAELDSFLRIYEGIRRESQIALCASMGLLGLEQMLRLKEAGVEHYHCNIETAPSLFPQLCTTHTLDDKVRTIRAAQAAGLKVCSGLIIGMGESEEQRVEAALFLRSLNIKSIPINTLMPIKGTKMEHRELLDNETIFRTMAMFRLVNPDAHIRMAGGRANYYTAQNQALASGVNASIVGDMLTTVGAKTIDDDMRDLRLK